MLRWISTTYSKRIVNINVNVVIASFMAILLTTGVLHLSRYVGVTEDQKVLIMVITLTSDWILDIVIAVTLHWLANHWPKTWKRSRQLINTADGVIDAAPPTALSLVKDASQGHLPNIPMPHRPAALSGARNPADRPGEPAAPKPANETSFVRDATAIQLQRLCLSPIFYLIATGGQWLLLNEGMGRELSALTAFTAAIIVSRFLHTLWMLKTDTRVLEEYEQARLRRGANNTP